VDGTRALAEATARAGAKMLVVQNITWIARPVDGSAFDEDSPFNSDPSIRSVAEMETMAREAGARSGFQTTWRFRALVEQSPIRHQHTGSRAHAPALPYGDRSGFNARALATPGSCR